VTNQISVQPDVLDLNLYAGDGLKFRVICAKGDGSPIDINGAIKAQIRKQRLEPDPPVETFSINTADAYQGIIILSLTGEQTAALAMNGSGTPGKFSGVWDLQWTPAEEEPRTLCQGKVECVVDVTR
jgi:hypothetical protein